MASKLAVLGAIAAGVLGLAIAVGYAPPGAGRRSLARAGATAFFAFLSAFFWLAPFAAERSHFFTGLAAFFALGGTISAWKLVAGLAGGGPGEKSATH